MLDMKLDDAAPENLIGAVIKTSSHPEVVARLVSALIKTFHEVSEEFAEISTTDVVCVWALFSDYIEIYKTRAKETAFKMTDEVLKMVDREVT